MRKIFIYLMLMFAVNLSASEIKWAKDFDSGIKEATRFNKPVFFVSSRHTCKYCVILEKTAFSDKKVIDTLNNNFVSIISYSDEKDYMPKGLWRPGTPALWFLKSNGEPMYEALMGALSSSDLLKAIDIVKKEFEKQQGKKIQ